MVTAGGGPPFRSCPHACTTPVFTYNGSIPESAVTAVIFLAGAGKKGIGLVLRLLLVEISMRSSPITVPGKT